jgi:hypothetical protein
VKDEGNESFNHWLLAFTLADTTVLCKTARGRRFLTSETFLFPKKRITEHNNFIPGYRKEVFSDSLRYQTVVAIV